ncbi:hypothetical protein [Lysinibacillus sphaericus]|uniref:Uncharacterized protein n=1 Tax=Lysinibacillus sphaericus OT4b.31 TaxID=1285586 RepID=R7ZIU4_LYSSH|nr:hypothetical protein [Lysinibacillus sphaericus]EON73959.1 hypothetical protein H131_04829 [Lysinibacillus sphaericus OT4b.31]
MVIKFNRKAEPMANYNEKRSQYVNAIKEEKSFESQEQAWSEMQNALVNDLQSVIKDEVSRSQVYGETPASNILNSAERKFFNTLTTDVGTKDEVLLPETTIDRIFEDLTTDHPLLNALGIRTTGIKTKIIQSDTTGTAVWGKVFGEIKGQLDVLFKKT